MFLGRLVGENIWKYLKSVLQKKTCFELFLKLFFIMLGTDMASVTREITHIQYTHNKDWPMDVSSYFQFGWPTWV